MPINDLFYNHLIFEWRRVTSVSPELNSGCRNWNQNSVSVWLLAFETRPQLAFGSTECVLRTNQISLVQNWVVRILSQTIYTQRSAGSNSPILFDASISLCISEMEKENPFSILLEVTFIRKKKLCFLRVQLQLNKILILI